LTSTATGKLCSSTTLMMLAVAFADAQSGTPTTIFERAPDPADASGAVCAEAPAASQTNAVAALSHRFNMDRRYLSGYPNFATGAQRRRSLQR
jgi:hypothetical protein